MLELGLHTAVYRYDTCCAMAADLKVREDDVLLTNRSTVLILRISIYRVKFS